MQLQTIKVVPVIIISIYKPLWLNQIIHDYAYLRQLRNESVLSKLYFSQNLNMSNDRYSIFIVFCLQLHVV